MKWFLLAISIMQAVFTYAATTYKLGKKTGDAEVCLTLHDSDNCFIMVCLGSPHYDHHISSSLSRGTFVIKGDTVYLSDSLWMINMVLVKSGEDYRITNGPGAFRGCNFKFERKYKEAPPSTASELKKLGFIDFVQVYDSIRNTIKVMTINSPATVITKGVYKFPMIQASGSDPMVFNIELKTNHSFTYRLNKDELMNGAWKQKGNHIYVYTNNQTYVLQVMNRQELKVLYFPFVDVDFVFYTGW